MKPHTTTVVINSSGAVVAERVALIEYPLLDGLHVNRVIQNLAVPTRAGEALRFRRSGDHRRPMGSEGGSYAHDLHVFGVEGRDADQHLVDEGAVGPPVDLLAVLLALEDLRRQVLGRAAEGGGAVVLGVEALLADAKVGHPHVAVRRDQHIFGLEVAIDDSFRVQILDTWTACRVRVVCVCVCVCVYVCVCACACGARVSSTATTEDQNFVVK